MKITQIITVAAQNEGLEHKGNNDQYQIDSNKFTDTLNNSVKLHLVA
jgi:hypothetical protein